MENINNEENKPYLAIIITVICTAIVFIGLCQGFWYEPAKAKLKTAENQLKKKDAIISDLRGLLENEKAEFEKFKSEMAEQIIKDQNEISRLDHKQFTLSHLIMKFYTRWINFEGNFCADEEIALYTYKWLEIAKREADFDARMGDIFSKSNIEKEEKITILSPLDGETWKTGSTYKITWISSVSFSKVDIGFYNGKSYTVIVNGTQDDGSYSWTVPDVSNGNATRVLVKGYDGLTNPIGYSGEFRVEK